jgi:hypothetical protein
MANYGLRIGQLVGYPLAAGAGSYALSGQTAGLTYAAAPGNEPFAWYPALDLSTIPFHAGSGVWGPQRVVTAPTAPQGPFTYVTVTTGAELQAQIYTPNRRITISGNLSTNLVFNAGNITDVDIIIPPGSSLRAPYFGNFSTPRTITRLRLRGPTVGSYSGGQIHQMDWADIATGSDFIVDGLALTGDVGTCAFSRAPITRVAVVNCIISSGCYALSTISTDMVVAGCTILRGQNLALQGTNDEEAYGWRMNRECQGYQIMFNCDLRSTPTRIESSHASVRCHPNPGLDYVYISNNRFVERVENWLFWCSAADGGGSGLARGVWYQNNECITDGTGTGTVANTSPKLYGSSTEYAYCQNNTFKSTGFTSDASINLTGTVNGSAGKSGNIYQSIIADPTWYSPGDPSTIDWTP